MKRTFVERNRVVGRSGYFDRIRDTHHKRGRSNVRWLCLAVLILVVIVVTPGDVVVVVFIGILARPQCIDLWDMRCVRCIAVWQVQGLQNLAIERVRKVWHETLWHHDCGFTATFQRNGEVGSFFTCFYVLCKMCKNLIPLLRCDFGILTENVKTWIYKLGDGLINF